MTVTMKVTIATETWWIHDDDNDDSNDFDNEGDHRNMNMITISPDSISIGDDYVLLLSLDGILITSKATFY